MVGLTFRSSTIDGLCSSRQFSHFAASFIDSRAEWSIVRSVNTWCSPCFCMSRSPDLCYRCAPLECSLLSQRVLLAMPDGSLRVTGTRDLERGFPCLVRSFHFDLVQARTLLAFKSASRLCIVAAGLTQLRYFERCSHSRSAKLCSLAACLLHRFSRFVT